MADLDPDAETIIYDVAGDVVELDDSIEIPERWEDLTESEYTTLLDQLGLPNDEILDDRDFAGTLPIVAVVGRPNVGKSTLVNRIIGRREAVVEDTPGVTRDRVRYESEWNGVPFIVVDTGGWEHDAVGMSAQVSAQAEAAINTSDVVVFVVDATNKTRLRQNVFQHSLTPVTAALSTRKNILQSLRLKC